MTVFKLMLLDGIIFKYIKTIIIHLEMLREFV